MLVLRRRAGEAIVFDGGLVVTLLDVVEHRAWLAFSAPSIPVPVAVAALGVSPHTGCIGVRDPVAVGYGEDVSVEVATPGDHAPGTGVLLVNRAVGERLCFPGLELIVASLDQGRAVLSAVLAELPAPVGVSVFSVSGAEVKIGIDAPDEVRVYREEVWLAMRSANEGAAAWSPDDLVTLTGGPRPPSADAGD